MKYLAKKNFRVKTVAGLISRDQVVSLACGGDKVTCNNTKLWSDYELWIMEGGRDVLGLNT